MIPRQELTVVALKALRNNPVTALLGPRQCGKTTLARQIAKTRKSTYFDLEDPGDLAQLSAPQFALQGLTGLVVIDEVQRKPELLELLRVLADRCAYRIFHRRWFDRERLSESARWAE